jgi:hypothetical protein
MSVTGILCAVTSASGVRAVFHVGEAKISRFQYLPIENMRLKWPLTNVSPVRRRALGLALVLMLSFSVRALTAQFMAAHLGDAGWFPWGIYAVFDRQAQNILDGRAPAFWIDDPSRTDAAIYPPGYPLWLALIYSLSGTRSVAVVQSVQWVMDSLSVLLIVGLGVTAYGWRVGFVTGMLAALSPLLALSGVMPLADAPTSWMVVGGAWMLLLAAKRESLLWALGAGLMVGASCWLRANALFLVVCWALVLFLVVRQSWKVRARLSGALVLGAVLMVTPLVIRNAVAFHAFMPTGLGAGTNLWEGIGETQRAAEFGAVYGDQNLLDQERKALGVSSDATFNLYYPDGVQRDRARARKAMGVIFSHPVWYAGVMLGRMRGVLNYAGEPSGLYGSAGINVTSKKCLPVRWQGGAVALLVTLLGMVQSVMRFVVLPLMVYGAWLGCRKSRSMTALILATVFYYLVIGSALHTEIRYGLAMQSALLVFAGLGLSRLVEFAHGAARVKRSKKESREANKGLV